MGLCTIDTYKSAKSEPKIRNDFRTDDELVRYFYLVISIFVLVKKKQIKSVNSTSLLLRNG